MSQDRLWTVSELLGWTDRFFRERGIENPRGNAENLIAHALDLDRLGLYLYHDRPVTVGEREPLRALVTRRVSGEPLQYILGYTEFLGVRIEVGPGCLIPRPETEGLVTEAIVELGEFEVGSIWDLGSGSGACSRFLAERFPQARVVALEVSPAAVVWTRRNLAGISNAHVIRGDMTRVPAANGGVDLVLSNPPYIAAREISTLETEVRDHEPGIALAGGDDGLAAYRALIPQAARTLSAEGILALEIGAGQAPAVVELTERCFSRVRVANDLAGIERVVVARDPISSWPNDVDTR